MASVSVWWVPAYLALMALIFIAPQDRHSLVLVSKPSEVLIDGASTLLTTMTCKLIRRMRGLITTALPESISGAVVSGLTTESSSSASTQRRHAEAAPGPHSVAQGDEYGQFDDPGSSLRHLGSSWSW